MADSSSSAEERRLRVLHQLGLLDSPREVEFDRLTLLATRLLRTPIALVSLVDADRQFFKSAVGLAEPWDSRREMPLSHSFCKTTVTTHRPLIVSDAREDPRVCGNAAIAELGVVAYAGIPLMIDNQCLGALCVLDRAPRTWTEEELETLEILADTVQQLIRLHRVNHELAQAHAKARAQGAILQTLVHTLPNAAVAIFDRDLRYVFAEGSILGAATGLGPEDFPGRSLEDALQPSAPGETRGLELYRAALNGVEGARELRRGDRVYEHRIVPVREGGKVVAGMALLYDVTDRKHEAEALTSAHAQLAERSEQLRRASITDELTGLHNRRGFLLLAEQALRVADRSREAVAIFFLDLDGMKQINDELGHEVGDRALVATAGILRRCFRESDILCRLGGDEFAVLAAQAGEQAVPELQARVRAEVEAWNARGEAAFELSISTGGVIRPPGGSADLDALLAEADSVMYARKRASKSGRIR